MSVTQVVELGPVYLGKWVTNSSQVIMGEKKRYFYMYVVGKKNNTPGEPSGVLQQRCAGLTAIAYMVW